MAEEISTAIDEIPAVIDEIAAVSVSEPGAIPETPRVIARVRHG